MERIANDATRDMTCNFLKAAKEVGRDMAIVKTQLRKVSAMCEQRGRIARLRDTLPRISDQNFLEGYRLVKPQEAQMFQPRGLAYLQ